MRVRIRPMVRRDLPQVTAIELACFGGEAWPIQAFKDLLIAFAGSRPARGAFWVAEDQATGEVVAYAGVEVGALWGEMDIINIAVAALHRAGFRVTVVQGGVRGGTIPAAGTEAPAGTIVRVLSGL